MNKALLFFIFIVTSGCVTVDLSYRTLAAFEIAKAGREPSNEEATKLVLEYLNDVLKDPSSIKQFELLGSPTAMEFPSSFGKKLNGWVVCFKYNAKNSYGAYTGAERNGVAIKSFDGKDYVQLNSNRSIVKMICS